MTVQCPVCVICGSRFSPDEDESCECSMEWTRDDADENPERTHALDLWWAKCGGKPIDEALKAWRASQ